MTVNAFTVEAFDTWSMRNMTDSVMTVAQHHGIKSFRGLYFGFQILVYHRPQRLAVFQNLRLHVFHQGIQLKKKNQKSKIISCSAKLCSSN